MKPKRIILLRHGESQTNVEPRHYAFYLTGKERKQAQQAGESIVKIIGDESVRAYASPWYRTRHAHGKAQELEFLPQPV